VDGFVVKENEGTCPVGIAFRGSVLAQACERDLAAGAGRPVERWRGRFALLARHQMSIGQMATSEVAFLPDVPALDHMPQNDYLRGYGGACMSQLLLILALLSKQERRRANIS
jgi:hypothetical protein